MRLLTFLIGLTELAAIGSGTAIENVDETYVGRRADNPPANLPMDDAQKQLVTPFLISFPSPAGTWLSMNLIYDYF